MTQKRALGGLLLVAITLVALPHLAAWRARGQAASDSRGGRRTRLPHLAAWRARGQGNNAVAVSSAANFGPIVAPDSIAAVFGTGLATRIEAATSMPDPREAGFAEAAAAEIVKLLHASRGRAFVLSTSYAQMQRLRELVEPEVDFPILMQGEGSRSGLLDKFRTTPHAVLFATASFWQGVDVRGEALSCVIIDKLPFAVPSDPVVAARQRYIDNNGGSSFNEYSVPSAVISLKQGVGRLIRSTTDRGVIALLDPRLLTKSYGQQFLNSLPPCRITQEIEAVEKFFEA